MLRIQANVPDLLINKIVDGDVVALLEHFHSGGGQHKWHPVGPTLIAWVVKAIMGERLFAVLLYDSGRFGLQNRIVIITNELQHIAAAIATLQIDKRGRARGQRLDARKRGMSPHT